DVEELDGEVARVVEVAVERRPLRARHLHLEGRQAIDVARLERGPVRLEERANLCLVLLGPRDADGEEGRAAGRRRCGALLLLDRVAERVVEAGVGFARVACPTRAKGPSRWWGGGGAGGPFRLP